MLAIRLFALLGMLLFGTVLAASQYGCTTNAECLKRGLPIKQPRSVLASKSRNRRSGNIARVAPVSTTTFSYTGKPQYYLVPTTSHNDAFNIVIKGAAGGAYASSASKGGTGGDISCVFKLPPGVNATVIVGGQGSSPFDGASGSGGGASVIYVPGASQPLLMAGAGGGIGTSTPNNNPGGSAEGFTNPGSGQGGPSDANSQSGGGGAGWLSSGSSSSYPGSASGGQNSVGMWAGGSSSSSGGANGGFGGAGGSTRWTGGAGAGYTGGAGAPGTSSNAGYGGGGGTSYVEQGRISSTCTFTSDNTGDGYVSITTTSQ